MPTKTNSEIVTSSVPNGSNPWYNSIPLPGVMYNGGTILPRLITSDSIDIASRSVNGAPITTSKFLSANAADISEKVFDKTKGFYESVVAGVFGVTGFFRKAIGQLLPWYVWATIFFLALGWVLFTIAPYFKTFKNSA